LCDKEGHLAKRCWNFLKLKKKQSTNIAEAFSVCIVQDFNNHEWFLDSGATSHITNNPDNLDVSTVYAGNERVLVGNGQSLPISHKGSVSNIIPHSSLVLSNVLVVQPLQKILFLLVNSQKNLTVVLSLILLVLIYRIKLSEWYWGSVDVKMVYMFLISTIVLLLQFSLPISHEPQFVYGMHN
jgi:hypothetical protein